MSTHQIQAQLLRVAGEEAHISSYTFTRWQTATFDGKRHQITLGFTNMLDMNKFDNKVEKEEIEIPMIGHKLCNLVVVERDRDTRTIVLEALTVME